MTTKIKNHKPQFIANSSTTQPGIDGDEATGWFETAVQLGWFRYEYGNSTMLRTNDGSSKNPINGRRWAKIFAKGPGYLVLRGQTAITGKSSNISVLFYADSNNVPYNPVTPNVAHSVWSANIGHISEGEATTLVFPLKAGVESGVVLHANVSQTGDYLHINVSRCGPGGLSAISNTSPHTYVYNENGLSSATDYFHYGQTGPDSRSNTFNQYLQVDNTPQNTQFTMVGTNDGDAYYFPGNFKHDTSMYFNSHSYTTNIYGGMRQAHPTHSFSTSKFIAYDQHNYDALGGNDELARQNLAEDSWVLPGSSNTSLVFNKYDEADYAMFNMKTMEYHDRTTAGGMAHYWYYIIYPEDAAGLIETEGGLCPVIFTHNCYQYEDINLSSTVNDGGNYTWAFMMDIASYEHWNGKFRQIEYYFYGAGNETFYRVYEIGFDVYHFSRKEHIRFPVGGIDYWTANIA